MVFWHKARQKFLNCISITLRGISNLHFTAFLMSLVVIFISTSVKNVCQVVQISKRYLIKNQLFIFVLLLILIFSIVIFTVAILPITHIFEGNLIVEEMSFTYNGEQPKTFLQSIRGINTLESEGIQTLTFTGDFQSTSLPSLNQINSLEIQLTKSHSKLILVPINIKNAKVKNEIYSTDLDLSKLDLQQNTKVTGLNYDFLRRQLAFSLQPNSTVSTASQPNILSLYLGEEPIKVTLEGYKLLNVNFQNNYDEQIPLNFTLNSKNKILNLKLKQKNNIYITLADIPKYESEPWFRGEIKTKDVQFERLDRNYKDHFIISTIKEGKIRMADQEKEIKESQFLMGENPNTFLNIQLIRHLQIVPKKGLETRFAGETKQIKIGLDKNFPVTKIQGSWLDGRLPRDAIIALFSFGAATVANLLSNLLSLLFSNSSTSQLQSNYRNKFNPRMRFPLSSKSRYR